MRSKIEKIFLSLPLFFFSSAIAGQSAATPCHDVAWCITNVTRAKVSRAWQEVAAWEVEEKRRTYLGTSGLVGMPLDGTIVKPVVGGFNQASQRYTNIYGKKKVVFAVRRSAQFLKSMFPSLDTLTLLRINTSNPLPTHPDPQDAHLKGAAADIAYPLSGDGRSGSIDFERTFWIVYSLAKTPGVVQVIVDYQDEIMAYGKLAEETGLVTSTEIAAMNRVLRSDKYRNHDTHLHVGVES